MALKKKKKKGKDGDDVITSNREANKGGECLIKHSIDFYHFGGYGSAFLKKKHLNNSQGFPGAFHEQGGQGGLVMRVF